MFAVKTSTRTSRCIMLCVVYHAPKISCTPGAKVCQPLRARQKQPENGNCGLAKRWQVVAVQPHVRHAGADPAQHSFVLSSKFLLHISLQCRRPPKISLSAQSSRTPPRSQFQMKGGPRSSPAKPRATATVTIYMLQIRMVVRRVAATFPLPRYPPRRRHRGARKPPA
jgi:hypothetical protein